MKLFVGNLSYDATQEDVTKLFNEKGHIVKKITVATDKDTGRPRGFAFVEVDDGARAISMLNGIEHLGRQLTVNEARPKPSHGSNQRGRGGDSSSSNQRGRDGNRRGSYGRGDRDDY